MENVLMPNGDKERLLGWLHDLSGNLERETLSYSKDATGKIWIRHKTEDATGAVIWEPSHWRENELS
ncbi:MAG: hypothetical protein HQ580_19260 [Planctomycetes bacterium]|nr:hypothetical protein [Planctomycetota bacterium]